jgi:fibronectin type 3 domain-containing protein
MMMMRGRIAVLVLVVMVLTGLPALPAAAAREPLSPTGLTATVVSAHEVDLSWNPVDGATSYEVWWGADPYYPYYYEYLDSTTQTGYRHAYLGAAGTYFYAVRTITRKGSSPLSAFVSATTPPEAPTLLQAEVIKADQVQLYWQPGQGATSYRVSAVAADGTETPLTVLQAGERGAIVQTVAETHYVLRVRGLAGTLLSFDYATVEITTPPREPSYVAIATPSPVPAGATTLEFYVAGTESFQPTYGTLSVSVDGGPATTVPVNQKYATLQVTVDPGTHQFSADYSGDGAFLPSHAEETFYAVVPAPAFAPEVMDSTTIASVAAADVTCDGRADLVSLSAPQDGTDPRLAVLPAQPDGTLGAARYSPVPLGTNSIAAGDLTRDGCADVAMLGGDLLTLVGSPSGLSTGPRTRTDGSMSNITLYDLTKDGVPDAVVNDLSGVVMLPGNGRGGFERPRTIVPDLAAYEVADLSGDGLLDVLTSRDGELRAWFQSSTGQFTLSWSSSGPIATFGVGDVNGDRRADVALGYWEGNPAVVVLSGQDGRRLASVPALYQSPSLLRVGDVDGNGQGDILGLDSGFGASFASLTYAGVPTAPQTVTVAPYSFYVQDFLLTDVSQDGRTDVVTWGLYGLAVARQT